jgi:formaldehyde-activating enzyme involved in methanogenesis
MWSNREHQVYSERTDLTPSVFEMLVTLTICRRAVVTADNAQSLWDADQRAIADAIRGEP